MLVIIATSSVTVNSGQPLIFSGHFVGGALHTVSVSIDSGAAIPISSGKPAVMHLPAGSYKCSLDIVVAAGPGALNRHYGIMIDVNGVTIVTTAGDIPAGAAGDTGHASLSLKVV